MTTNPFYNEILTEHNVRPEFKHDLPDADLVLDGVNPSCGDEIQLKLRLDGDTIADGAFVGDGCAISQASTDIMLGMIVGKSREEALRLGDLFLRMIRGRRAEEIDSLEGGLGSARRLHMPARVKCAMLGWRTLREALGEKNALLSTKYNAIFAIWSLQSRAGMPIIEHTCAALLHPPQRLQCFEEVIGIEKATSVLLCAVMVLSLAACGKEG